MASRKAEKASRKKDRMPKRLFRQRPNQVSSSDLAPSIPQGIKVVFDPAGQERMSDVLERFLEPFDDDALDYDSYEKLLNMGMLAWNAALLPEDEGREMIDEVFAKAFSPASDEVFNFAWDLIEMMIERKLRFFPDNLRAILSFKLTDMGDGFHLSVVSTLDQT